MEWSPRMCARSPWWARQDSNLGPTDYESIALTAELRALVHLQHPTLKRVSNHHLLVEISGELFWWHRWWRLEVGICGHLATQRGGKEDPQPHSLAAADVSVHIQTERCGSECQSVVYLH